MNALVRPIQAESTLAEAIDRLLDTGVVIDGQIVISLAGVDLVFIGVRALLASVEAAARSGRTVRA